MCCNILQAVASEHSHSPFVRRFKDTWSSIEKQMNAKITTIILEKSKQSVCACGCVNVPMQPCIHKCMNTFVYIGGCTCSAIHALAPACMSCLYVPVPVCPYELNCFYELRSNLSSGAISCLSKPERWVGEEGGLWRSTGRGGSSQSLRTGRVMQQPVYGSNIKAVT